MAFALVTSATGVGTTAAADTTGANLLVAAAGAYGSISISDSKGNTWSGLTTRGVGGSTLRLYYVYNPTVGSGHTVTAGSGSYPAVSLLAFSGANASPFDAEAGGQGSGATVAAGSVTPAADGSLLVAGVCWYPGGTLSIDSGYSSPVYTNYVGGVTMGAGIAYLIQSSAAASNPAWGLTSNFTDAAVGHAAFAAAPSAGNRRRRTIAASAR